MEAVGSLEGSRGRRSPGVQSGGRAVGGLAVTGDPSVCVGGRRKEEEEGGGEARGEAPGDAAAEADMRRLKTKASAVRSQDGAQRLRPAGHHPSASTA